LKYKKTHALCIAVELIHIIADQKICFSSLFILALDSIKYSLGFEDTKVVQVNLTRFTNLIRKNLEINQEKFISIDAEADYFELYLSLEKLRFDDHFEYQINIHQDIDIYEDSILAMLIQPFVEKAIWHGLMPQGGKGKVVIDFTIESNSILITK
jgi:LytS/YehU family sensor histidine kinase